MSQEVIGAGTELPVPLADLRHGPRGCPQVPAASPSASLGISLTNGVEQKKQIAGR